MQTEVVMTRELFGSPIRQKSKSEYYNASDLVNAGNRWRMLNGMKPFNFGQWLKNSSTVQFLEELEKREGRKVVVKGNCRNSTTWIHPFVFIDLALAISPQLKVEAYKWLYDRLLEYRNDSGDSYKKMCGSLWLTEPNKSAFKDNVSKLANRIKAECGVEDWETNVTEEQLKLRDKIHENISILADVIVDREALYRIAIKKAKDEMKIKRLTEEKSERK